MGTVWKKEQLSNKDGEGHKTVVGEERTALNICYRCVAIRDGITEDQALNNLTTTRNDKQIKRAQRYKESMQHVIQFVVWAADLYEDKGDEV